MIGLRSGWLALFVFVWVIGIFLGSTFDYQSTTSSAGMSYSAGTATFTTGSATVIGAGTAWSNALMANGLVKCNSDGRWYKIRTVVSTTNLTLYNIYGDVGGAVQPYTMMAAAGWVGTATGGYTQGGVTKLDYLLNMSNAVNRIAQIGAIPIVIPNGEYFGTAFSVLIWRWSFMENYAMFYWVFCAPFVVMGVLSLLGIVYGLLRGNITWG